MNARGAVHALVEELPDSELPVAVRFLEFLKARTGEVLRLHLDAALPDDEVLTDDDLVAIEEGFAEAERGEVVTHEEVRRRLAGVR